MSPDLRGAYRGIRDTLSRVVFERRLPGDTASTVHLEEYGLNSPERHRYEPSRWFYMRRALWRERIGPDDVFVDFGAGKGRAVIQAAHRPFGRVVGVDI